MTFDQIRAILIAVGGAMGGLISVLYGEITQLFVILVGAMILDYASGIIVAVVFKASPKTPDGGVESRAGLRGLFRKGGVLVVVLIAHWLDVALGLTFVMDVTIMAFIANEGLSIIENLGLAGVPVPDIVKDRLTQLDAEREERARNDDDRNGIL